MARKYSILVVNLTRPGAKPISNEEEFDRVVPIVESIASRLDVVISVDTSKPKNNGGSYFFRGTYDK